MAINIVDGITHTVFLNSIGDNLAVVDPSCVGIVDVNGASLLTLRTMDPPSQITTLVGRTTGQPVNLILFSYFDYEMRRKAETLKHNQNKMDISKKQQYSKISQATGGSYYYSSQQLTRIKNNLNCPNSDVVIRPPTNSGVHDYKYLGYYYDKRVPYLPSL
jgi:hypothetical protein